VLFVTGFADRSMLSGVSETRIVRKPFMQDELASKIVRSIACTEGSNVVPLKA